MTTRRRSASYTFARLSSRLRAFAVAICASVPVIVTGCGRPNAANIELRKQNQSLNDRIVYLELQHKRDVATVEVATASTRPTSDVSSKPVVDPTRMSELYIPVSLKLGRLTGVTNIDYRTPDVTGLKVQISPEDDTGDVVKATGTFVVEATDPTQSPEPLIGRWEFSPAQIKRMWYSTLFVYAYILPCPWQGEPPKASQVRVKVRFVDLLTGRTIGPVEKVVPNQ
jgi:hypothetical protein